MSVWPIIIGLLAGVGLFFVWLGYEVASEYRQQRKRDSERSNGDER